jgi:hypothetical protein
MVGLELCGQALALTDRTHLPSPRLPLHCPLSLSDLVRLATKVLHLRPARPHSLFLIIPSLQLSRIPSLIGLLMDYSPSLARARPAAVLPNIASSSCLSGSSILPALSRSSGLPTLSHPSTSSGPEQMGFKFEETIVYNPNSPTPPPNFQSTPSRRGGRPRKDQSGPTPAPAGPRHHATLGE